MCDHNILHMAVRGRPVGGRSFHMGPRDSTHLQAWQQQVGTFNAVPSRQPHASLGDLEITSKARILFGNLSQPSHFIY